MGVVKVVTRGRVSGGITIRKVTGGGGLDFCALGTRLEAESGTLGEADVEVVRDMQESSHSSRGGRGTRSDKRVHDKDGEIPVVRDQNRMRCRCRQSSSRPASRRVW